MGKKEPALVDYFKDGAYQGVNFRFQTFTQQDLGMVYAVFNDDYLIITSSWKSMSRVLDKLQGQALE